MAKEALFNILENHFDLAGISALDLFSGTGSISYEFASRGVPEVVLVEKNHLHIRFIRDTVRKLNFFNQIKPHQTNAFSYLRHAGRSFDIIFADPPYNLKKTETLPGQIFEYSLLKPGGWFILEHSNKYDFQDNPRFLFARVYGQVHFTFFSGVKKKE